MTDTYKKRRMYVFLLVLLVGTYVGFQGWRTLLNNFAVEVGHLSGMDMGLIQSVREIPGFLALLALYVILIIREHKLAALSVALLGVGVTLTGLMPSTGGIVFTTLLMSFGFHYYETMNQSLTLQYFNFTDAPLVMGRLRSLGALTNIVVGGFIYVAAGYLDYSYMFAIVGCVAVAAGVWGLTQDPSEEGLPMQRKQLVFKWKYWLYYALTFLSGARRQIFVAFAIFLLVEKFHYSVQHITVLFVINNVVNYFVNPLIGKAVNKYGERSVLTIEYTTLTLVFMGYAFTESSWLAAALYIVDNIVFNFAMAIKTFYQKIADKEDIASGMAVGFTINHIAAVVVPFMGGLLWLADYRAVFMGAAALSVVSLLLSQLVSRQLVKFDNKG